MSAEKKVETFSPKAVTGVPFDEIMRRAMQIKPERPKKKSRPKKAK
jgi:hypothetical protein